MLHAQDHVQRVVAQARIGHEHPIAGIAARVGDDQARDAVGRPVHLDLEHRATFGDQGAHQRDVIGGLTHQFLEPRREETDGRGINARARRQNKVPSVHAANRRFH